MDYIQVLEKLEPVFREAAKLAEGMQGKAERRQKLNTGNDVIDIVTNADLETQEFLLKRLAETELVNCRLLAEEDTPSVKLFNDSGDHFLCIDPIDGTSNYANGGKFFSIVVSLHDGKELLYTYKYFPRFEWTIKIVKNKCEIFGATPEFQVPTGYGKKIIHYEDYPEKDIPEIWLALVKQGFSDATVQSLGKGISGTAAYVAGKVAGYYSKDPNAYDGLVCLHYAQATGRKIYLGGPDGKLGLGDIRKRESGYYYPGYYLAL